MVTHVSAVASIAKCRNKSLSLLSVSTQGVLRDLEIPFQVFTKRLKSTT